MPQSDSNSTTDSAAPPSESFAAMLGEAQRIHGVSLWQDAWRRLRRNRMAMLSLSYLALLALATLLTPLLPLQSPLDKDLKNRVFRYPSLQAVSLGERPDLGFAGGSLTKELAQFDESVKRIRAQAADLPDKQRHELLSSLENRQHPFDKLWHKTGPVTKSFIRLRLMIFGDWCVPSICGTDNLGRDVLARLFWGARVSLVVGLVATLVSLAIGVSYGATAGYLGGLTDVVMMRIVDVMYSVPFIFVVIFIITILREETVKGLLDTWGIDQIMVFYLLIGAIYWLTMSRVVRGQVISLKNEQFIEAARAVGASRWRIIFRHLIPNVMGVVIVYLTLTIPAVMLFEAFLSFLGLGVEPPDVSWGLLVNEGIKVITPIRIYWWLVLFPGLTLSLTLFALNFLGDGLRDALDPRMKNR